MTASHMTCLLVEDEALIGMALESYLEDEGLTCFMVTSSSDAMRWLSDHTPSVAVLDYKLKDGPCALLATALRERDVPFVIYSGLPARAACPELQGVPWIDKPAARTTLLQAITTLASVSVVGA
jgi:DNA-binding response OmpR family regulator